MVMNTRLYQAGDEQSFDSFVLGNPESLLYVSRPWLDLLAHYLESPVTMFLAWHDGRLRGALPVLSRDGPGGIVANSLPFKGARGTGGRSTTKRAPGPGSRLRVAPS